MVVYRKKSDVSSHCSNFIRANRIFQSRVGCSHHCQDNTSACAKALKSFDTAVKDGTSANPKAIASYTSHFHKPGLEDFFWDFTKESYGLPRAVLDIGSGTGFWGFLVKAYYSLSKEQSPYIIGVDLNKQKTMIAKLLSVYDDLVVADAYHLPFRDSSFEFTIAVEVYSAKDLKAVKDVISQVETITSGRIFMTFHNLECELAEVYRVISGRFKMFIPILRNIVRIEYSTGRAIPRYDTFALRMLARLVKVGWIISNPKLNYTVLIRDSHSIKSKTPRLKKR